MSVRASPFSIVPVEAALDHRLTAMQYRVLIAILSFRNRNTDTARPHRATIAQRCGYSESNVSRVTTALVQLGWLEKVGLGGRSRATEYRVRVPDEVPETLPGFNAVEPGKTVADAETVAESATVAGSDTKTAADPATVAGSATVADPNTKRLRGRTLNGCGVGKGQGTDHEQTMNQKEQGRIDPESDLDPDPDSEPSDPLALDPDPTGTPFERFWSIYPRRVKKKQAKQIWQRNKLDAQVDQIIADVQQRHREDRSWLDGFIPHPPTYLNGERWNDEIERRAGAEGYRRRSGFSEIDHDAEAREAGFDTEVP